MHTYYKVKDMLCDELERIASKDELSTSMLDIVDKLTHSIKSIDTIIAMEDYEGGHSERGMSYARRRRGGMSYDTDMGHETVYARRGYSRDDNKEHLISRLENMAMDTTDEHMKATIHKCINELEKD